MTSRPLSDAQKVLLASRALVGVAAKSLVQVEGVVSAMQWRAMVVVSRHDQLALNELATALGVHASTGTRLCDQLVAKGLIRRRDHPADRRYLMLTLTPDGRSLVDRVNTERQHDIDQILQRLPEQSRSRLVAVLLDFAQAAGEVTVDPLWDLSIDSTDDSV